MTEARMKRDSERLDFLEKIKVALRREFKETHDYDAAQIALCMALAEFFALQRTVVRPLFDVTKAQNNSVRKFLREMVVPGVRKFARTPEEFLSLMADLFEWAAGSVVGRARGPLLTQEIEEPEKVFSGRKVMNETV